MNAEDVTSNTEFLKTDFAPAGRAKKEALERDISFALENQVIREILSLVDGLVVVLNPQRQIIALNRELQSYMGLDDPSLIFGQRPGEAMGCVYADVNPGGCGTSSHCTSCGAIGAVLDCQRSGEIAERKCALRVRSSSGGEEIDMVLSVRACPVRYKDNQFVVVFMHDITEAENRGKFESMFFHDALNTLNSIISSYRIIKMNDEQFEREKYLDIINMLSNQLSKDIKIHRMLSRKQAGETVAADIRRIELDDFLSDMSMYMLVHTENHDIHLKVDGIEGGLTVRTDPNLLHRVVMNMLINAVEASDKGDTIRLWAEKDQDGSISISVWNKKAMPPTVADRMFQRFYSTKAGDGRGVGTQSMKYIGEKLLGGKVYFTSTPEEGTVFTIELPTEPVD